PDGHDTDLAVTALPVSAPPVPDLALYPYTSLYRAPTATVSAITDNGDGTYTATYTPTVAGTDQVAITLGGTGISGSPYSSVVSSADADAINTTASVPVGTAGEETTITVTEPDEFDNPVTDVAGDLAGSVNGANTASLILVAGPTRRSSDLTYTPTVAGTDQVAITLGGTAISGSPYSSVVSSADADATNTTASVPAGTAGEVTTVTITVLDEYNNAVTGAAADLAITLTGANATATVSAITDNGDGTYTATYTPTVAGADQVAITLGGTGISGGPYSSVVSSADADVTNTTASVPAGTAGEETTVTVTVLDEHDNAVTGAAADLAIKVGRASCRDRAFVAGTAAGSCNSTYSAAVGSAA